jgi:hypothetical protein
MLQHCYFWELENYKKVHGEKIGYEKYPVLCKNITKILGNGLLIKTLNKLVIQDDLEQYNHNLAIMLIAAISIPRNYMLTGKIELANFVKHIKFILNVINHINNKDKTSINQELKTYSDLREDTRQLLDNLVL